MSKEYLSRLMESGQRVNPLFPFLGVVIEELSAEKVRLALPFREDFIQGGGVIAGGIMATLADEAMAHVVLANLAEGQTTATIEMNLRFLKPITKGDIMAEATLVKKGRQIMAVEAMIRDQQGKPLAQAGASFMVVELKK